MPILHNCRNQVIIKILWQYILSTNLFRGNQNTAWLVKISHDGSNWIPCGTKFLREFIFAHWRFFVFCGNYFLRLGQIGFSCWELTLRFSESPVPSIDNIFVFNLLSTCNINTYFQIINQYFVVNWTDTISKYCIFV